jgi:hypothetical protein
LPPPRDPPLVKPGRGGGGLESRGPKAGEGGDGAPGFGSGVVGGGSGLRPGSLDRWRGLRRDHRRRWRGVAEVVVNQRERHPRVVGVGAMGSSPS